MVDGWSGLTQIVDSHDCFHLFHPDVFRYVAKVRRRHVCYEPMDNKRDLLLLLPRDFLHYVDNTTARKLGINHALEACGERLGIFGAAREEAGCRLDRMESSYRSRLFDKEGKERRSKESFSSLRRGERKRRRGCGEVEKR